MKIWLDLKLNERSNRSGCLAFLCLLFFVFSISLPATAQAAIPKNINFQGKLTKVSDGTNVTNGSYAMEFKIYDALTNGTLLWTETYDQPSGVCTKPVITNGAFNVKLGTCNSLDSVDFASASLYVSINFAPTGTSYDGEMAPRKQLVASAYSFNANNLIGDGRIGLNYTPANTTNPAASIIYNPGVSSSNNALTVTAETNVTGAAVKIVQNGSGGSLLFGATALGGATQTYLGGNPGAFSGNFIDFQIGSASKFKVDAGGSVTIGAGQAYTGAGAVTLSSAAAGALTLDSSSGEITLAANDGLTFAATTLGSNGSTNVTINAGSTGTTATLLVKLDASGTVVTTDTTTLNTAVGVALDTKSSGQAVRVATRGVVTVTADNAVSAGDFIGLGTTTAGRAKSLGATYPSTAGVQVIGRALSSQATPGSTFLLMVSGLDNSAGSGGSGITTVRESDLSPSVSSLTGLEFGPASTSEDEFVVTDQTGGVARVVLGSKAVKTDATQTLTNKTIGSTGLTFSGASTDIDTATAEGLTLQGRAASAFNTTSGNISFQPAGSGTTANVQIGAGGGGSTTPDLLVLDIKSDAEGALAGTNGAMYYNSSTNKFRCYQNSAWTDCIGGTGGAVPKESHVIFFAVPTAISF